MTARTVDELKRREQIMFGKSKRQKQIQRVTRNAVLTRKLDNAMKQSAAQDRAVRKAARAKKK